MPLSSSLLTLLVRELELVDLGFATVNIDDAKDVDDAAVEEDDEATGDDMEDGNEPALVLLEEEVGGLDINESAPVNRIDLEAVAALDFCDNNLVNVKVGSIPAKEDDEDLEEGSDFMRSCAFCFIFSMYDSFFPCSALFDVDTWAAKDKADCEEGGAVLPLEVGTVSEMAFSIGRSSFLPFAEGLNDTPLEAFFDYKQI